jgi:hypothetical protein
MRKNPKLMMQMLPDSTAESDSNDRDQQQHLPFSNKGSNGNGPSAGVGGGKSKMMQQIEDAKRWGRLQELSKNFLEKRDLIEALENEHAFKLSSPIRSN